MWPIGVSPGTFHQNFLDKGTFFLLESLRMQSWRCWWPSLSRPREVLPGNEANVWLLSPGHKRDHSFRLGLMHHSLWGRPAAMLWGHSSSPMEWSKKNWGLLPTVPTCQACKWTILSDSPTPGKPSDDYSPIDILTATSWQTPSQKHSVKPFPNSWPTGVKGDNMFTHFHMSQHIIFSSTI